MSPEQTRRRFFLILLLLATLLLAALIRPLGGALLIAAVLAGVLWPVQRRLSRRFGDRDALAAGLLTFSTLLLLVGPIAALSAFVIDEARDGAQFINETLQSEGLEGLLHELPAATEHTLRRVVDAVKNSQSEALSERVAGKLNEQAPKLAAVFGGALAATWGLVFDTAMMLIALYFLLCQGTEAVAWLDKTLPLRRGQTHELLAEFRKTSYAVVVSTIVTAAAQAAAALIGYLIARVPHPVFFAAITFFGAFIPAVGAASFTLLAAAILLITGHPYMALFLAVWAVVVVGLVDNVIKPMVLRGGMDMPGAVVFFALIGGLGAFGPIGLIMGPLTVAFFVALLRMYWRDQAEAAPPTA